MPVSRIALPLLLVLAFSACVANAGGAASASPETVEARVHGPVLQNRADILHLMQVHYPTLLRDAEVTGIVVVRVTLDADGAVADSRILRSTHDLFSDTARQVASRLRFSAPGAAGESVTVRLHFAKPGQSSITVG